LQNKSLSTKEARLNYLILFLDFYTFKITQTNLFRKEAKVKEKEFLAGLYHAFIIYQI